MICRETDLSCNFFTQFLLYYMITIHKMYLAQEWLQFYILQLSDLDWCLTSCRCQNEGKSSLQVSKMSIPCMEKAPFQSTDTSNSALQQRLSDYRNEFLVHEYVIVQTFCYNTGFTYTLKYQIKEHTRILFSTFCPLCLLLFFPACSLIFGFCPFCSFIRFSLLL